MMSPESSVQTLQYTATPKNITLEYENFCRELIVNGNENALLRIFNNILSNAIKFTPENGKVSVTITRNESGSVLISFKDTGIGITGG